MLQSSDTRSTLWQLKLFAVNTDYRVILNMRDAVAGDIARADVDYSIIGIIQLDS